MAIHAGLLFVRTDMSGGVLGQIGWEKPPGRYGDEGMSPYTERVSPLFLSRSGVYSLYKVQE
jgi:hypothetical protein